jgi:AcrR family transcriptional regulator
MTSKQDPAEEPASWRASAVDRVLGPARQKAEERLQRFLDAAVELTQGPAGTDFSVHDVVERSGQSLRSFYEYFDGKHELLLALLDSSVRSLADELQQTVDEVDEPLERLHTFFVTFYHLCRTESQSAPVHRAPMATLGQFALQLFSDHPREAMRAFAALNNQMDHLLNDALDAGVIASSVPVPQVVAAMMEAVMFDHFAVLFSGDDGEAGGPGDQAAAAEELWDIVLLGLNTRTTARPARARPARTGGR